MIKYVHTLYLIHILILVSCFLIGCEKVPDILDHQSEDIGFVSKNVSLIHHMVDPGCGSGGFYGPCVVTQWDVLVLEAKRTYIGWQVEVYEQPKLELHHITVTDGNTPIDAVKDFTKIGDERYSFVLESSLSYMELTVSPLSTVRLETPENDPSCIEIIQDGILVLEVERTHIEWLVKVHRFNLELYEIVVTDGETPISVVKDFVEVGDGYYSFVLDSPLPYMELTVGILPTIGLEILEDGASVNCTIQNIGIRY